MSTQPTVESIIASARAETAISDAIHLLGQAKRRLESPPDADSALGYVKAALALLEPLK
jgi:hypothetical protein